MLKSPNLLHKCGLGDSDMGTTIDKVIMFARNVHSVAPMLRKGVPLYNCAVLLRALPSWLNLRVLWLKTIQNATCF